MSDVEMMLSRNWEQRRHAEEYEAAAREKQGRWETEVYADFGEEVREWKIRKQENRRRNAAIRAAGTAGRMALAISAVSALMGWEVIYPLFGLVAVIFYAIKFELQPGNEAVWTKIFT